jgi:hypothetical protein
MSRVLIVGVPRSGTTWTGRTLGHTEDTSYVNEPDGFREPFAFRVMLGLGEQPLLEPGDRARDYERLWAGAFDGGRQPGTRRDRAARFLYDRAPVEDRRAARATGRPSPGLRLAARLAVPLAPTASANVVVKSVQSILSLDWVFERFRPRVLVVERNPLNVLASWSELGFVRKPSDMDRVAEIARRRWGVDRPADDAPHLVQQAFVYGALTAAIRDAVGRHDDWVCTTHEHLCVDSRDRFAELAGRLGLQWGEAADRFLRESDREGRGFRTNRRTGDQPERWRERLDEDQVRVILEILGRFPHELAAET